MKYDYLYFGKKLCGAVFVILLSGAAAFAQEQKSEERLAEEAYSRQEYGMAAGLYERLVKKKHRKAYPAQMLRLAACYREMGRFAEAAVWYEKLTAEAAGPAEARFSYGEVLRNLERYPEAKAQYEQFHTQAADSLQLKHLAIAGCDSAVAWANATTGAQIKALDALNTDFSEVINGVVKEGLLLVANGYRKMWLNGGPEKNPAADRRMQMPYYKPYVFKQYDSRGNNIYLEELLPDLLGGYRYHIGPVCLNKAQDTLYVTINEQEKVLPGSRKGPASGMRRLFIFQSVKRNGYWSEPVPLPQLNIPGHSSSHPALAEHGNLLYFISDRPGGQGQTDIWYSEKQADGSWGAPVNCGAEINTIAAEAFPTVNEDGVLYFSSKGHVGLGGYDIFRARGNRSEWARPVNMQTPYNTGGDDIGLILKHNGFEGFISSNRAGGSGSDDVYAFTDAAYFTRLEGDGYDRGSNGGYGTGIGGGRAGGNKDGNNAGGNTGGNNAGGNTGGNNAGGNTGGNNAGGNTGGNNAGGNNAGGNNTGGNTGGNNGGNDTGGSGIVKRTLTPEEEADKRELEKLQFFYDYNSTQLLPESRRILDYAAGILKKHPHWKLVVVSFTDSRGSDGYNKDLSSLRCYAVINYLDNKDISPKRIYYHNMGESRIINGCKDGVPCNAEQHKQNRRSELRVIY